MEDKHILQDILSQDEYTDYYHASGGSFWEWLNPVWRWIKGRFPNFDAPSDGVLSLFTYILIIVLIGLSAFAIYWFVRQLVRHHRAQGHTYLPVEGHIQSYTYYWKQALEFDALGDWRQGVRAVFLSLVFYLDDQQRIKVEKWKTNWEYANELASSDQSVVVLFHDCSVLFERTWYGNEAVHHDEFHSMLARVEQVIGIGGTFRYA